MSKLSLVQTADGSNTFFNAEVGEHYHSRHGALQEALHVFVKSGLEYFIADQDVQEVSILEVGFGTGLNFLLSAGFCTHKNIKLNYTGIEAYPLPPELISQTGYQEYVPQSLWAAFLQNYPAALQQAVTLNTPCTLQISPCKLMDFNSQKQFDVLYFDAFAAIHQPEMWTDEALKHITSFLKPGGVFVTYAITGNLKRIMKALKFSIEKAPGAPGKREMLRAVKLSEL
ncbi:MAG TPA: tRNA (5-methylaminomethyl-2-thiouridine)(34)-methyltransferase MnmD [Daejeonella sp.]|nr:tRNA (5-methylaminomethyl-2-thiouridine)(34)-methyltransferase MnmD [Daejeonella sp.]